MSRGANRLLKIARAVRGPLRRFLSRYVKAPAARFVRAHEALEEGEEQVITLNAEVEKTTRDVALADQAQDSATLVLATNLAGDGFARANPFSVFGAPAPSAVINQGHLTEADTLRDLVPKVLRHPDASASSKKAATNVATAAANMSVAIAARNKAVKARAKAVEVRDSGLVENFRLALQQLREAIRYADATENTSSYDEVFGLVPKAKSRKKPPVPSAPVS